MTPVEIQAVVAILASTVSENYVFPEVAERVADEMPRSFAHFADDRSGRDEFASILTARLQELTHDKHLRVRWSDPTAATSRAGSRRILPHEDNFGVRKIEVLDGNIALLELREFYEQNVASATIDATVRLISHADAVIIDLRQNRGGDPATVNRLFSYFMPPDVAYLTFFGRDGRAQETLKTRRDLPQARLPDLPLFVLTSSRTFSGGEEFAYDVKTFGRGTIVGETTGGGANPGEMFPLVDGFSVFVPTGRPVNPITNTNWESVGVTPDIPVAAGEALERAVEEARKRIARGLSVDA